MRSYKSTHSASEQEYALLCSHIFLRCIATCNPICRWSSCSGQNSPSAHALGISSLLLSSEETSVEEVRASTHSPQIHHNLSTSVTLCMHAYRRAGGHSSIQAPKHARIPTFCLISKIGSPMRMTACSHPAKHVLTSMHARTYACKYLITHRHNLSRIQRSM